MKYQPLTCVWEVTMRCNMNCKHCGSSCNETAPAGEMNNEQALAAVDQMEELGLRWITLSGGEPLIREDIDEIVKKLRDKNIMVNIITNGWLMTDDMVKNLKSAGISTVAISIDGTQKIHDSIRKEGSFARAMDAYKRLIEAGITTGAITTITKKNLSHLPRLREELIKKGVESWQVQIGLPMGNLKECPDWVLKPEQMDDIIEFCYETSQEGKIKIYPADCIGYYSIKEMKTRQKSFNSPELSMWDGCNAGIRSFGLLHNGDVLGCTSIRSKEFVEGNILQTKLYDIWCDDNKFTWRRDLKKSELKGFCQKCIYGNKCLGGCPNTRLTMKGSIHEENEYCAYNLAAKRAKAEIADSKDWKALFENAKLMVKDENYQQAALLLEKAAVINPNNFEIYNLKGFADYMCANYDDCISANEKSLELKPDNPYALKGLGIAMHKNGNSEEGVKYIEKAAKITNYKDLDILNDLRAVLLQIQSKR